MAAIDKCYTDSLKDYKDFKDWARGRSYTTPRGVKINVSDYIIAWDDKNFFDETGKPKERPIFNSPGHFDNYLYHNCQLEFIQDWLEDRYSGDGYCKGLSDEITCTPQLPDYTPCTKVKVLRKGLGECPWKGSWCVEVNGEDTSKGFYWYNEDHDFWIFPGEDDDWTCSHAYVGISIRAIIRKIIKKWKLPVGCTVTVTSGFTGDVWILKTK